MSTSGTTVVRSQSSQSSLKRIARFAGDTHAFVVRVAADVERMWLRDVHPYEPRVKFVRLENGPAHRIEVHAPHADRRPRTFLSTSGHRHGHRGRATRADGWVFFS